MRLPSLQPVRSKTVTRALALQSRRHYCTNACFAPRREVFELCHVLFAASTSPCSSNSSSSGDDVAAYLGWKGLSGRILVSCP
ncbi:unnamed protein product [Hymenolepis diminuta]|uniref:Secreted protein n=1 Tax=Hymenolepis diminuta TaxID=6216 RepID=A0A0R3SPS6_HYMDI|nr:unnamed protein product [Hymenolepis diminuta]